jgi:hypothetical protein
VPDVVDVPEVLLAPPLPEPLVVVGLLPAEPPGMVSSPPHACAAMKGSDTMTSVPMSLRILHLLLNIEGRTRRVRDCFSIVAPHERGIQRMTI